MRALLKLLAMEAQCTPIRILNNDAKTVVRLLLEVDTLAEAQDAPPFASCLWLKPVRGYEKEAKKVSQWLTNKGWTISHEHGYLQGLAAVKKRPEAYSSKIRVHLQPTLRADEAAKVILRELLHVIKYNTAGVKNDIDTECLHDFRVAIRRTRAVLSQMKEVFPADVTAQFKKDFAYVGTMTNHVRDLDVYLLHKARYTALLPAPVRPDIEPLFAHLQRERAKAFRTLVRRLDSKTYANILHRWEAFLAQPPAGDTAAANASRPIIEVVRKRLRRRCRSVVQLGTQLLAETDDQRLHALRIACKKLRYVLEFFVSLLPGKKPPSWCSTYEPCRTIWGTGTTSLYSRKLCAILPRRSLDQTSSSTKRCWPSTSSCTDWKRKSRQRARPSRRFLPLLLHALLTIMWYKLK